MLAVGRVLLMLTFVCPDLADACSVAQRQRHTDVALASFEECALGWSLWRSMVITPLSSNAIEQIGVAVSISSIDNCCGY